MTSVAILPVPSDDGLHFEAVSGKRHAAGRTAGGALDALAQQYPDTLAEALVIVQLGRADEFFPADKQQQLEAMMQAWRDARDEGRMLPPEEEAKLRGLVDDELRAAMRRTSAFADAAGA
jgi:hypothetical protein